MSSHLYTSSVFKFPFILHIFKTTSNALFKKYKLSRGSSTLTAKALATAQDSLLRNVCFP